jgi:hypothetical protein
MKDALKICVGYGKLSLKNEGRNEKKSTYLVIFNGRWLKYSSHLRCIIIILNVEGRIGHVM